MTFDEIFIDDSKNITKIDSNLFSDKGDISIVDQGKKLIAGYIDNKEYRVCNDIRIVFGDHTRIFKYIDFPFVCGADGTKVLKLKEPNRINYKYIYYYLLSSNIPNTGYNRHFKWLKELNFNIHNQKEQMLIVDKLDLVNRLINIKNNQIEYYNNFIKSQFVEMFGDPVINDMNWKKSKLFKECEIITGNTPSRKIIEYYGDYIEWIKSDNIIEGKTYLTYAKEFLSEKGLSVGRSVDANSILMTCIAGSLRSIGNVSIADRKVSFNQQINGVIPKNNNVYFMYEQFVLSKDYLHSPVNMSLKGILSKSQLSNLEFIFPPTELQDKFGEIFEQIDKQKFELEKQVKKLEELQASLMQEYFG